MRANKAPDKQIYGRILIAEDDSDFRQMVARVLARMGLSVIEAVDGIQAKKALRENSFDLIIVDMYMPGATGLEVVKDAQAIDPDLLAIVLTASATLQNAIDALRAGVFEYLTKPFESIAVFKMAVDRALEHRRLIRENKRLFAEVQRLAATDPLTGLYNRYKLNETLKAERKRAERYGHPLSLLLLDLDHFKAINDTYGHLTGDRVLQQAGSVIRKCIRDIDLAARYGGDEFLVLMPEADLKMATTVAARIHKAIAGISIQDNRLSASIGVGQWLPQYESCEDLLKSVDQALYASKSTGGKRIIACVEASAGKGR